MIQRQVGPAWRSYWRPAAMLVVYVFLYAPIVLLVLFSFNDSRFTSEWHGFTLRWYGNVLGSREWLGSAWTSLHIATVSTVLATSFGTTAALGLERTRFRARGASIAFQGQQRVIFPEWLKFDRMIL